MKIKVIKEWSTYLFMQFEREVCNSRQHPYIRHIQVSILCLSQSDQSGYEISLTIVRPVEN